MSNTYQVDLERIKPKYWSEVVPQLQTLDIPLKPLSTYYKCLQTLKYLMLFDSENSMVLGMISKYELRPNKS